MKEKNTLTKSEDLIGTKFGNLTIISKDDDFKHTNRFNCLCDCGAEISITWNGLRYGKTNCGCQNKHLEGQRFGKLVVEKSIGKGYWLCKCDCGNEAEFKGYLLEHGQRTSCGCRNESIFHLEGHKFGRLTVLYKNEEKSNNSDLIYWHCECDCGNECDASGHSLRFGKKLSCGCLGRDKTSERSFVHGLSKTKLYSVWFTMKSRCYNPKNISYPNYGARGIQMCDEWLNDFVSFYNWSYENGYEEDKGLSIDRIDTNGNYEPSNCRWVDRITQANNTRKNTFIEIDGVSHTYAEWGRIYNIDPKVLRDRIIKGWDTMEAIQTPIDNKGKKVTKYDEIALL